MKHARSLALALPLALSTVAGTNPISATPLVDRSLDDCAQENCGAVTIGGSVLRHDSNILPWVAQIVAREGECLRIEVTRQGNADLEAVLIAPNGAVFRNDNISAENTLPRIKVDPAPRTGWYTLQLSQENGAPVIADFTLVFGRYNGNNMNCKPPTLPVGD
jgi:hypothetical protein